MGEWLWQSDDSLCIQSYHFVDSKQKADDLPDVIHGLETGHDRASLFLGVATESNCS